jgi:hypothetical protein
MILFVRLIDNFPRRYKRQVGNSWFYIINRKIIESNLITPNLINSRNLIILEKIMP